MKIKLNYKNKELENLSLFIGKKEDFIKNILVKFFICEPEDTYCKKTYKLFKEDHYYLIAYFILRFDDYEQISHDQIMAIIFFVYTFFVDDWGSDTINLLPGIEQDMKEFENICIRLSLLFSKEVLDILQNPIFSKRWKIQFNLIINKNIPVKKKIISLKEIEPKIGKSLINDR